MTDNEIRKAIIQERRRKARRDAIGGWLAWISWAALGWTMFAGAWMAHMN